MRDIEAHQSSNHSYIEEGIKLLEMAHRGHQLLNGESSPETSNFDNWRGVVDTFRTLAGSGAWGQSLSNSAMPLM